MEDTYRIRKLNTELILHYRWESDSVANIDFYLIIESSLLPFTLHTSAFIRFKIREDIPSSRAFYFILSIITFQC